MKKLIWTACIMLAAMAAWAQDAVTPDAFEKGMKQPGVQVLDVRTAKEFNTGHLPDALQADFTKKEEFYRRLQSVDKTKPVYIYCLSGGRSTAAAKWMRENGYKKVIELNGGTMAWKQAGKPLAGTERVAQMSVEAFGKAIAGKWVLVDVGADWCPPCRKMEPVVKRFIKENKVKRVNVNGGNDIEVMKKINTATLPTFVLYKDGKEVWRKEGIVSLEEFQAAMK
ncbi:rhodanese-like domain-containing protein [Chitinophaga sp. YIM B06452]|uniref:rhodanese-like domain-containing protein n=1 Tax=Chitinophaga sp. YIM B06452 TaxID=3082158 RepID=UPI0031FEA138